MHFPQLGFEIEHGYNTFAPVSTASSLTWACRILSWYAQLRRHQLLRVLKVVCADRRRALWLPNLRLGGKKMTTGRLIRSASLFLHGPASRSTCLHTWHPLLVPLFRDSLVLMVVIGARRSPAA